MRQLNPRYKIIKENNQHIVAIQINYFEEHNQLLKDNTDIDDRLAEHIARLFVRDPVPSYEGEHI